MKKQRSLPGDPEFWLFIALDACIFYAIYVYLAYYRWADPDVFFSGQSDLSPLAGAVNTVVLLLSSYFVANAVTSFRNERIKQGEHYFLAAICFGTLFLLIKLCEYLVLIQSSPNDLHSTFHVNYFSFTGLHLFHLVIGLIALWVCRKPMRTTQRTMESTAIYWHFVDVIWIFLFLQLYLAK